VSKRRHLTVGSGQVGAPLPHRSNWVLASQTRPREDWVPMWGPHHLVSIGFWPCSWEGMGISGAACRGRHFARRAREGEQGGVDPLSHVDYSLPSLPSLAATLNPPIEVPQ